VKSVDSPVVKVVEKHSTERGRTLFICDFSPPRGADPELLEPARHLGADFISVAYNPGKSARVNSVVAAHWIKAHAGRDVTFTIATRDMNKVAVQSLLLGAQLLGLENLVVVKGDEFSDRELAEVKDVSDFRPTELLRSIGQMNQGVDFKGLRLRSPADFCIGATIDLGRGIDRELRLTRRKAEAGAQYFISQPTFHPSGPSELMARYAEAYGEQLLIFHGVQVMAPESLVFGNVPQWVTDDLARGRSGVDIALQVLHEFAEAGLKTIYLVPPVLRGGRRDYEAAQAVLEAFPKA
jgi:5,10-methylenetetrahydrofolate reductase